VSQPFLEHILAASASQGARAAARPEASDFDTALTFGDVPAEYRAGIEGSCLFEAVDRERLIVSGGDALGFLHRLLANDVRSLAIGEGNRNLLLSAKGKVLFDFELARFEERLELSTPPGQGQKLAAALDMYLFSEDVKIEEASQEHRPLELGGPGALETIGRLFPGFEATPAHAPREVLWNASSVHVTQLPVAGAPGFRLDAGAEAAALWTALVGSGALPAGLVARDMLRVERGAALFGVDVDENIYPQEARLGDAFSLEKGCYIGQEVVAKIETYGGLNKRLEALAVDGDEPIPRGTKLLLGEANDVRELGLVTTWAYSFVLDSGCVLAYVKRKHQTPGTRFVLGDTGFEGTLVELPIAR